MLNVTVITVGNLKEGYLREASAEYEKRLGGFCKLDMIQLKETKLPESPTDSQISAALTAEGKQILAAMPPRAYRIAMCVEGQHLSSEQLAQRIDEVGQTHGAICLVIGSSYGIAPEVKAACDFRLSVSKLTFPHQLMRVILLEAIYRALGITKGTKYHK